MLAVTARCRMPSRSLPSGETVEEPPAAAGNEPEWDKNLGDFVGMQIDRHVPHTLRKLNER
jgi:hypothetical protein